MLICNTDLLDGWQNPFVSFFRSFPHDPLVITALSCSEVQHIQFCSATAGGWDAPNTTQLLSMYLAKGDGELLVQLARQGEV